MPNLYYPLEVMQFRNDAGIRSEVSATFGRVRNRGTRSHQGWDLFAPSGTPCFSVADGYVAWIRNAGSYGLQLGIEFNRDGSTGSSDSTDLVLAFYAHLSRVSIAAGTFVRGGQQVAETGTTGNASARFPHLHFELRTLGARTVGRGLVNRIDPSEVFGYQFLSCNSTRIGGVDLVAGMSITTGVATPVR